MRSGRTQCGRHICVGQRQKGSKAKGAHAAARMLAKGTSPQGVSVHGPLEGEPPPRHRACLQWTSVQIHAGTEPAWEKISCLLKDGCSCQNLGCALFRLLEHTSVSSSAPDAGPHSPVQGSSVLSPPPALSSRCEPGPPVRAVSTRLTACSATTCLCFPDFFTHYLSGFHWTQKLPFTGPSHPAALVQTPLAVLSWGLASHFPPGPCSALLH